jgi:hypothetical protein
VNESLRRRIGREEFAIDILGKISILSAEKLLSYEASCKDYIFSSTVIRDGCLCHNGWRIWN